jgi:hypothetical protein
MNSRRKGAAGERELAGLLRTEGWVKARRSQQFAGNPEGGSGDVVCGNFPFHIEAKRCQALAPEKWLAQARRDAPEGKIPSVFFRRNGDRRWMVLLDATDVCELARQIAPPWIEKPVAAEVAHPTTLVVQGQMISTNNNQRKETTNEPNHQ